MMNTLRLIIFVLLGLTLFACGVQPASRNTSTTGVSNLLTTTTILADVTRNIAGDRLVVEALLPIGSDPHAYQPTPQDIAKLSDSQVLIINGAEYEHFLEPLLENGSAGRVLIEASTGLVLETDLQSEQGVDPHLWLDPNNVITYAENIRNGLAQFDPEGAEFYQSNASAYIQQLTELDAWINGQVAQVQPERRVLVTNHEAFGYFAERYGFTVVGSIVQSFSSDSAPSAQQMAALIDQIKDAEAPAIFLGASDNPALAQQISAETGVDVITDLHVESLTEGAPAATYIDMMRHNVTRIVNALQ